MADVAELCTKTLTEVAGLIKTKEVSPVELTQAMLERVSALDGRLHSYITVTADLALEQAQAAEQEIQSGRYRGLLHGVPIAVKDLCYTKGIPTTAASPMYADFKPDFNATVVEKFYAAGAVLLGKLAMTEFALSGYHPSMQPPVNPWSAEHWPGASSSGSGVATAASPVFWLPRLGHGWFDPFSVRCLRHCRGQTDLWQGQPLWRVSPGRKPGSCRSDDA